MSIPSYLFGLTDEGIAAANAAHREAVAVRSSAWPLRTQFLRISDNPGLLVPQAGIGGNDTILVVPGAELYLLNRADPQRRGITVLNDTLRAENVWFPRSFEVLRLVPGAAPLSSRAFPFSVMTPTLQALRDAPVYRPL